MKIHLRAATAALLLIMTQPAMAQPAAERWAAVDDALSALTNGPQAPLGGLAVVAVEDGQVAHAAAYGCAVHDPAGGCARDLTVDTPVRVASISKLAVGLTAMVLAGEGRLDLDRDVSDYLGFPLRNPHAPDVPITVRMLLDHTSSLRDGDIYALPVGYALADLVTPGSTFAGPDRWADGARAVPGAWFEYTNLNYGVLATAIERITGERFDRVVERVLLAPLGIDAAFDVRRLSDDAFAGLAPAYRRLKDGTVSPDGAWTAQVDDHGGIRPSDTFPVFGVEPRGPLSAYAVGINATTLSPQGGLRISAEGLSRILRLILDDGMWQGRRILPPGTVAEMSAIRWRHDPANPTGDSLGGVFPAWGTGIQCGVPLAHPAAGRYCGHMAEAYGLLGGLFFDPATGRGFLYLITGTGAPTPVAHPAPLSPWEEGVALTLLETLSGR